MLRIHLRLIAVILFSLLASIPYRMFRKAQRAVAIR
jgi:type II secretory pathway component PulJ